MKFYFVEKKFACLLDCFTSYFNYKGVKMLLLDIPNLMNLCINVWPMNNISSSKESRFSLSLTVATWKIKEDRVLFLQSFQGPLYL